MNLSKVRVIIRILRGYETIAERRKILDYTSKMENITQNYKVSFAPDCNDSPEAIKAIFLQATERPEEAPVARIEKSFYNEG